MAIYDKRTDYRKRYPGLSDAIIKVLEQSDRKMEYQQYDLKAERYRFDISRRTVTYLPSREDSYDRLMEEKRQFADESESVEDAAVKAVMIERMLECLKLLTSGEQRLITELFFKGKSEYQMAEESGIPRMTIHDRKAKILRKLKRLMEQ